MDAIIKYLTDVLKQSKYIAEKNYNHICKYEDIKNELLFCIENDEYPEHGVVVEDYSAMDIHQLAPFMNYLGVYNFLINLIEDPQGAKAIVKDGFKVK